MELRDVAHELYGLAPADFTAARNARAKEARAAKDRALATRLAALPRPSAAAWAVNLLVRRDPGLVDQLLSMGAALREAQASLSGADLRDLNRQQHQLLVEVRRRAEAAARDAGHPLSPTIAQNVHATLHAAMADPDAAEAVRSGLLVADLQSTGFGPVDVDGAVAPVDATADGEDAEPAAPTRRRARPDVDELEVARQRRAAAGRAPGRSRGRAPTASTDRARRGGATGEDDPGAGAEAQDGGARDAGSRDRATRDRDEAGRADREQAEQERAAQEQAERERAEAERAAAERERAERAERERAERERAAAERAAERERAAAERRRRAEVGRRLARAEKELAAAERSLAAADETVEDVEGRHEQTVREIAEAEQRLARLRARRTELDAQLGTARAAADDAAATRDDAQSEVDRLRDELDEPSAD
ncbi:hypothetical protein [Cellulomonas sp. NS3]|uniref:hypothetical protein n=1 Tax=Cellulomonas sp. NS3 TaxID=2973977 RepID=UPI002161B17A|nr:hypothetical protein [Cellulomonas sp. NS3]